MRKIFFVSLFFSVYFFSQETLANCTTWQKGPADEVCLMPGGFEGVQWTRTCEQNYCQKPCPTCPMPAGCLIESICSFDNLAPKESGCHDWIKVPQVTCKNPERDFEQKYFRICSELVEDTKCTDDTSEL